MLFGRRNDQCRPDRSLGAVAGHLATALRLVIDHSLGVVELKLAAGQQLFLDLRARTLDARFRARERDAQ
jgi:hypothetical protein